MAEFISHVKPNLSSWTAENTKLLISIRKANEVNFISGTMRKKAAWNVVASEFNDTVDVQVTGDQCWNKWKKLEEKFKKTEEHNAKTGRDRKTCEFYDELADFLGDNPKITPLCTISSAESANKQSSDEDDDGEATSSDDNNPPKAKKKKSEIPKKRRRTSRSSAAEMIDFLREFKEEKQKEDEEKLNAMMTMHEDKMQIMDRFLKVMENK